MNALIQRRDGIPATEGCFAAWKVISDAGWAIRFFERIADVEVHEDEVVVGGIDPVVQALTRLGIDLPDVDYPDSSREVLLDPKVERTTIGAVRRSPERWPRFVKPTSGRKEFDGLVIRSTSDLLFVTHLDDELPVFSARPEDMVGRVEWRCFFINGRVRDIRPYMGCADGEAPLPERLGPFGVTENVRELSPLTGNRGWDALIAGVVEDLAYRHGVKVPKWAMESARSTDDRWWFVTSNPALHPTAFVETPASLANRGVFIRRASLVNV